MRSFPLQPLAATCMCMEKPMDRCSFSELEDLHRDKFWPLKSNTSCAQLVIQGLTLGTVLELMQPTQQPHGEYQITSLRPLAAGLVMLTKSTSEPPSHQLYKLPASYCSRYITVNCMVGCLRFPALSCTRRFSSAWVGLMAGSWILLTMGVVPSCRGWGWVGLTRWKNFTIPILEPWNPPRKD